MPYVVLSITVPSAETIDFTGIHKHKKALTFL